MNWTRRELDERRELLDHCRTKSDNYNMHNITKAFMVLLFTATANIAFAGEKNSEGSCLKKLNKILEKDKVTTSDKILEAAKNHMSSLSLEKLEIFKMPNECNELPGVRTEIAFHRQKLQEEKRLAAGLPVDNAGKFEDQNDLIENKGDRAPASSEPADRTLPDKYDEDI